MTIDIDPFLSPSSSNYFSPRTHIPKSGSLSSSAWTARMFSPKDDFSKKGNDLREIEEKEEIEEILISSSPLNLDKNLKKHRENQDAQDIISHKTKIARRLYKEQRYKNKDLRPDIFVEDEYIDGSIQFPLQQFDKQASNDWSASWQRGDDKS